jgi:3-methyladenine DNA glycosylase/8-oxoguanine DNA glycosylase
MTRTLATPPRYDFLGTLAPLVQNRYDPCARLTTTELWWACRTPIGPATLHLANTGDAVTATGYGPGGEWVTAQADAIAGLRDDVEPFIAMAHRHPVVAQAWHRRSGLRMARTGRVFVHVMPTVFAQKVTGMEAIRAYTKAVRHFGEPAPGPYPHLLLPPDPERIRQQPYWVFHPFGVEAKRADALRRTAAEAPRLEAAPDSTTATARLTAIPGIGIWTAAEVTRLAYGDPDAVSIGDYHIPHHVVHALTGAPRAGSRHAEPGQLSPADARMLELLEPFRGQRARVCQLLLATAGGAPRFGPRMPIRSFAHF